MKTTLILIAAIAILTGAYMLAVENNYIKNSSEREYEQERTEVLVNTDIAGVQIAPIQHASFVIDWDDVQVYIDPVGDKSQYRTIDNANIIAITHDHPDHFSTSTIAAIASDDTEIIVPQAVFDQLPTELQAQAIVLPNNTATTVRDIVIGAVPAYNLADADNADNHPTGVGNGYIFAKNDNRVYVAGDTANTPEMRTLSNMDIAFIPMNVPYTMSVQDAADAVIGFAPQTVYPYHYRNQDGTFSDIDMFEALVTDAQLGIKVVSANWYPDTE